MEIYSTKRDCWGIFSHYHYLTSSIPNASDFYVGFINDEPVAFVSMTPFPHPINKNIVKSSRIVTLPHWQGYGLGMKMSNAVCSFDKYKHKCIHATTTLPIRQSYLTKSPLWILKSQGGWDVPTTGKIAATARTNIYLETHKFVNDAVDEYDLKPHYGELKEFGKEKKTNDHKMEMLLERIEINKVRKAEREIELAELEKVKAKKDAYYGNLFDALYG